MRFRHLSPLVLLPALFAGTAVSAAPYSDTSAITANVPHAAFRDLRQAPSVPVRLTVVLRYRNESQLAAFDARQAGLLPAYQTLSADQFRNYFSPTVADYQATAVTFERLGFRVVQTYRNRTVLDVQAPASTVDRVFGTIVHAVIQPSVPSVGGNAGAPGGLRYANVRPATLPAQLRSAVYGVLGFDNLITERPAYVRGRPGLRSNIALGPPVYGPDGGFGPFAFADAYNFLVQHQVRGGKSGQTYDGTGQATGNVIDSDFPDSDLSGFLSYFGITRTGPPTQRVEVAGGAGIGQDEVETDLDVETIVGTSPGTALYVYLIPNLVPSYIDDAYNRVVSDDLVDAANSSFAGCETDAPNFNKTSDHIAMQGEAEGINFTAATGDYGAFLCYPDGSGPNAPAIDPHFMAMGGTSLYVNADGSYKSESGWSSSGGGVSTVFPQPSYQNGIANINPSGRNIPDVSFDANPYTGASFYFNGTFQGPIGGTSLASPLMSSLITQFDEFAGRRLGDLHPGIYDADRRAGYHDVNGMPIFRDVTGGNNGYPCVEGYDLVTGIGSIDGYGAADAYKPGSD